MNATQVHIVDRNGDLLYTRLLDSGENVLPFEDGFGFVTRDDIRRYGWAIKPGWPKTRYAEEQDRRNRN